MGKKIFVAGLMQESNSFATCPSDQADFTLWRGPEMLARLPVERLFTEAGYQVIPSLMARAVPGGCLKKQAFDAFCTEILDDLDAVSVDGIWLNLHGALDVSGLGSGEAELLRRIRAHVGNEIPIAVALDLHANNTPELIRCANIVVGYRTAPHVDGRETQIKAAELLLRCLHERTLPKTVMVRIPVLIPGERATTAVEPMRSLMDKLTELDRHPRIWHASFFVGMAWVDTEFSAASVVLVAEAGHEAQVGNIAVAFAEEVWSLREQFDFEEESDTPDRALATAARLSAAGERPFFLTDSGDNVTAGAPGDSVFLLEKIYKSQLQGILIAGLFDQSYVTHCSDLALGTIIKQPLGGRLDTSASPLVAPAVLLWRGAVSDQGENRVQAVLMRYRGQAGDTAEHVLDVLITDKRLAFTDGERIAKAQISPRDYPVVIVKQGYLFAALRKIASRSMMVLTPGSSDQCIERFTYSKVNRPIFPLDGHIGYNGKDWLTLPDKEKNGL